MDNGSSGNSGTFNVFKTIALCIIQQLGLDTN